MKKIILIKLGGSVITDKTTSKKADFKKINSLSEEISKVRNKTGDLLIIGHGAGSFAHQSAAKYKTIDGLRNKNSLVGMSEVRYDASLLNMIVLESLLNSGIPVFTIAPSAFITSKNKKLSQIFVSSLLNLLKFKAVPLVYGDVITDSELGCTIYSTEQVLNEIATTLPLYNYQSKMIIEVGKTEGVLNEVGETIPEINSKNIKQVISQLSGSHGTDVTGGMLHKVKEAYSLAQKEIPTLIISSEKGTLEKAVFGKDVQGTWIKA